MSTTLITNGIVVDAGTMRPLDILISGERVESLLPRGSEVRADRVIDASGIDRIMKITVEEEAKV